MKKIFITYGDTKFAKAKERILREALSTQWFDVIRGYSPDDISDALRNSGLMEIPRGGGLWAWKPDVIVRTMEEFHDGDILVYADSGCTLTSGPEWDRYASILREYDIIGSQIFQTIENWTRKEILDAFNDNPDGWLFDRQYCATIVIVVISPFTRKFMYEWRDTMIAHPRLVMDVLPEERPMQHASLIENRHDQSIYSALVYKYLQSGRIYSMREHIEDYDVFSHQAIRATRLRNGEPEPLGNRVRGAVKRILKTLLLTPKYFFTYHWKKRSANL